MTGTSKHLVSFFVVTILGSMLLLALSGLFLKENVDEASIEIPSPRG